MNEIAEHFSSYYLAKLHRCAWLRAGAKLHIPSAMNILNESYDFAVLGQFGPPR